LKIKLSENQIKQCRSQAQTAAKKSDREFWLQLAHRWEALSQGRKDAEVPKIRTRRAVEKRFSSLVVPLN
jgi:hypothetical protein